MSLEDAIFRLAEAIENLAEAYGSAPTLDEPVSAKAVTEAPAAPTEKKRRGRPASTPAPAADPVASARAVVAGEDLPAPQGLADTGQKAQEPAQVTSNLSAQEIMDYARKLIAPAPAGLGQRNAVAAALKKFTPPGQDVAFVNVPPTSYAAFYATLQEIEAGATQSQALL